MRVSPIFRTCVGFVALILVSTACAATPTISTAPGFVTENAAPVEFAASREYLAHARVQVERAQSMRFEVYTEMDSAAFDLGSRTEPFMTGEWSGTSSRTYMDMGTLMGPMAALSGMDTNALRMTFITHEDVAYMNAPFFAEILRVQGGGDDYEWVQVLADGWGSMDASDLGGSGDFIGDLGGGASADQMLSLLDGAGEVLDGGVGEVRGEPTRIAHASVSLMAILENSGQDLDDLGLDGSARDALNALTANVAVYVGDDDLVRRLEYTMDMGAIADLDPSIPPIDMKLWQRVDFFDIGVAVDIPVPMGAVDISDDVDDLLKLGG